MCVSRAFPESRSPFCLPMRAKRRRPCTLLLCWKTRRTASVLLSLLATVAGQIEVPTFLCALLTLHSKLRGRFCEIEMAVEQAPLLLPSQVLIMVAFAISTPLPIWFNEVPKIAKNLKRVNNYLPIYFSSFVYVGGVVEIL
jgi:hypothetical protein